MAMRIISVTLLAAGASLIRRDRNAKRSWSAPGLSEMPSEPVTLAGDATCGGLGEMGCEDQRVGFGCVVHRPSARLQGGLWELTEHRVPVRLRELQRMVHHVAPEQRVFAPGAEPDAGVVDAVTGAREKGETFDQFRPVHDDLPGQPGVDHGSHAVLNSRQ